MTYPAQPLLDDVRRRRYADAIVRDCLKLQPGETLTLNGEVAHRELLVACAESGYRAGAGIVDIGYRDPLVKRARIALGDDDALGTVPSWAEKRMREITKPRNCNVFVVGEELPGLLGDLPAERIAEDARRYAGRIGFFQRAQAEERLRFCIPAWPTPGWAVKVYPELPEDEAERRLLEDILWFCRLGPDDPADGWERHMATLAERARTINERAFASLEYRGPGTDMRIGLAPGTVWHAAETDDHWGRAFCANFPTEEVFTSPDAASVEGTFRCSRPLVWGGRVIEELAGELTRGRLVRLSASNDGDRDALAGALDADRGGRRLGEVALVDSAARIGQAGRVYWDTLLDENASSHIAFGFGFSISRTRDPALRGARGVNRSGVHIDVMIGSDELEITGVGADGSRTPIIAGGDWQL